ncbi:aminodeoxychorismate synthase component I [Marinobacterium rhizophilum]|uniref:aminodeoxychorismate synthase n=1 Tax=Marinobacterium rhizophilum TaxID=420402 RepID=A0ABY5HN48_9GAMM|nr:aminodeoxychorismate synthase component I [Marinobacterium rhizophilum]UTW13539.1 aminodeoxychorismate synthase component I [Marinobacterium rhizophilum]
MINRTALDYREDSSPLFEAIRDLGSPVWLDSGRPLSPYGRFDILAAAPDFLVRYNRGTLERVRDGVSQALPGSPFDALRHLLAEYPAPESQDDLPFCGGLIGHLGYDLGRALEALPALAGDDIAFPEMRMGFYSWAIVVDHQRECAELIAHPSCKPRQLDTVLQRLRNTTGPTSAREFKLRAHFNNDLAPETYNRALARIDAYIKAGDCYQVNFTQRFSSHFDGDPWQAYQMLRRAAPTPYSAYLESEDGAVLSLSPEQFLCTDQHQVTTKPIKGTRARGNDRDTDAQLKQELRESTKDRAENLMIVDLMRNDLGKVCALGTVKVPRLFAVESYANVHHLVTTVTGTLADQQQPLDLLEHCFPGGSITGAPKIRAMEIIDELEPQRRNIYCGSIGYISLCGRMDTSITIRTLLCEQDRIYCWAGGGIVADSVTEQEYAETYSKVNNLLKTLEATRPVD